MRAEIISSGTELLLGEVTDTNTPFLARGLAEVGISVYHHTTVGDNPQRLLETVKHAESRANLVIISGGLGPTQDDITKHILADHLGLGLYSDEESLRKIKGRYQSDEMSVGNYHQSLVIDSSTVFKNDMGMAAGMLVEKNNIKYVLLPGPPNEFEHMVTHYVLPFLSRNISHKQKLQSRNLKFYGIPEAVVAEKLNNLIEKQTNPTIAVYAKKGIIDIRITASGSDVETNNRLLDNIEAIIMAKIGKYFFGYNKTGLEDIVFCELKSLDQTIAVIELNTKSRLTNYWNKEDRVNNQFKASFFFANRKEAQDYFKISYPLIKANDYQTQNEKLASKVLEEIGTDFVVAVSSRGEINRNGTVIPEKILMSIVGADHTIFTKEVQFTRNMYYADWVIPLKVSDFVRRYLLSLDQLEN